MDIETLFTAANSLAGAAWLLLVLAPRWRWSARLIAPVVVPAILTAAYATLMLRAFPGAEGGFGSLAAVGTLFEKRELLLAGWLHYLAFDLFVGSWEVRDSQRLGVPHAMLLPCLALTFLLGPVGLVVYLGVRSRRARRGLQLGDA